MREILFNAMPKLSLHLIYTRRAQIPTNPVIAFIQIVVGEAQTVEATEAEIVLIHYSAAIGTIISLSKTSRGR